jgi:cobyrinic acid a,c-diamide synthase
MAKWLGLPVLLVVDARSMARSAAALVYGFSRFDPSLRLAGVIFNRIGGEGHLAYLKEAMAASLPEIPVLGGMLREDMVQIPERHLGLVTADEVFLSPDWRRRVVEAMEVHLDLDGILNRTASSEGSQMGLRGAEDEVRSTKSVPIAVARDAAFCFYYPDNLELLERWGGRLLFFSPLAGESVPPEASGVYLGGGYPELFAEGISSGGEFLESLRRGASKGMPIYAECGGLMVLSRFIETKAGKRYPMAGLLPFGTRMLERRKALGYTEVVLTRHCLLGEMGSVVRGHEFHYSEIVEREEDPSVRCVYELSGRKHQDVRPEGYVAGSVLASYIHLHWGSAPGAGKAFVKHCAVYGEGSFPTD